MEFVIFVTDMDRMERQILNPRPVVLEMLMLQLTPIEVDQEIVPEETRDLWPNLDIKMKKMHGQTTSIGERTSMENGM